MSRSYRFRPLAVAAALALAGCGGASGAPAGATAQVKVPVDGSPQRGPADAWVTLVEFADFECPYCRQEEPVLADLLASYGADLRLVFKHFPLSFHAEARPAAIAAECAFAQDRFWELHHLLVRTALDSATVLADAGQVPGLDVVAWQACLTSPEAGAQVDADAALGASVGVRGTPTFVVNGEVVVGAVPEADLRAAVDRALAAARASGVSRADYYDQVVLGR